MSKAPWLPVATKGCLNVTVLSRGKARTQGILLMPGYDYLLCLYPDGDDEPLYVNSRSLATVLAFLYEMEPRSTTFEVDTPEVDKTLRQLSEMGYEQVAQVH